ncbi:sphingomyelin phosphodiesterase [Chromobacterium violaceum]|uniref:sphingomyelin phosphodiesterase n=1 Tax=Chromobacterium violaceum TaxID=536 RepID=UPI00096E4543|nr:sphingomyelin phosphodiesterase [Chromobacterium violaceum]MBX9268037.1 sphingomyelin phosphodiesterase [Chromobacterium violaceum]OLZ83799.1 sphingomyelin phosphodiesterase [Chromobacterium violaceum]STB71940.1 Phospholipase C precursor [Chromobacterium violaceum]
MKAWRFLLCAALSLPAASHAAYPEDLKLATWNAMLLPQALYPNYGQMRRVELMAAAPILQAQDVLVFQELQDNAASDKLLALLKPRFPYQTPVIGRAQQGWDGTEGWNGMKPEDGGVAIASRWPIVEKRQYLFQTPGCSWDGQALKGFAYARIAVNGQFYHVIGTHLQSEDSGCANHADIGVRQAQLREIAAWVQSRHLPVEETVIVAGDMNIDRYKSAEYRAMLDILQAGEPRYAGMPHSFDTAGNGIALERYGARGGDAPEYLDYILTLKGHRQPAAWHNQALDAPSPQWTAQSAVAKQTYAYADFSDHYPVQAFAWADAATPTRSLSAQPGAYRQISLQNLASGRYVQAGDANDGWLKTDAAAAGARARFNLSNNFSMRDNGCIRSGEYVRLERADRPGWFWTWWGGVGGNQYAYYTAQGPLNRSAELRLINHSRPDGCLQDGDVVSFKDWARAADYYLTAWVGGSHADQLYLWQPASGDGERFRVRMGASPQYLDWRGRLLFAKRR